MSVEAKVIEHIRSILEKFDNKYMLNGRIKKSKVIEDLDRYDHNLMEALLSDKLIHDSYTEKLANVEVFKVNQFIEMLEFKKYWEDSYTKYSNKIGLTAGGKFIDESTDVVLDFPFKDTVLKAGMSKEDLENSNDADEPFLNEVIAKPEIDELFEPKILVNARRYDNSDRGGYETSSISDDDNLIIKGNNLIALHSLKKRYAGKVKLIYLDPPYNTGADSFEYNDQFSRSAWLTFIKNRVEIAMELLSDDGVLLMQISFHEYPYLRTLVDTILSEDGHDRHIFDMNVLVRHPERALTADKPFNDVMEYTLIYSKNYNYEMPKQIIEKTIDKYIYTVDTKTKPDEIRELGGKKVEIYLPKNVKVQKEKADKNNLHRETVRGSIREKNSSGRYYVANIEPLIDEYPPLTLFKVPGIGDDKLGFRYFELPKKGLKNGAYYQGMPQSSNITKKPYPNFVDFVKEYNSANKEGVYSFRNGKKPEAIIKKYIDIFTNEKDLVLDFFMGSATTQAVAMKMGRRFIGIEQMDYINTVSVPRLQEVIDGEQSGISKDVNWQGGGSFIYTELMEKNQGYLKDLQKSKTVQELMEVYKRMKENADVDFRLDLEKFEEELNNFNSLDERRRELIRILDKNQLYYNYANIDDENVRDLVSDNDYEFNKIFYSD
ncbi:DNA methyltransferase [Ligilactobacillus salivarius]|uniref:DNA methyltransferase n=1 Tax=Ligilactobacillus salivarius TaxID=1624 RepID=UPI0039949D14